MIQFLSLALAGDRELYTSLRECEALRSPLFVRNKQISNLIPRSTRLPLPFHLSTVADQAGRGLLFEVLLFLYLPGWVSQSCFCESRRCCMPRDRGYRACHDDDAALSPFSLSLAVLEAFPSFGFRSLVSQLAAT